MKPARAYFDWNASAPLKREARAAMVAALDATGNASSVHTEGRRARALIEEAREQVAVLVGAKPAEVVFTSCATEANNWVLAAGWDTILMSEIEHESVRAPARASGAGITTIPVTRDGVACTDGLVAGGRRLLATLQMANNETGVLQPVAELTAAARAQGAVVHTDAVQAVGRVAVDFAALGVDLMSVSSHKIGGPKGAGALVVREGTEIASYIKGGGQERRRRAGTENVAAIAGFGAAAQAALADVADAGRMAAQRDQVERSLERLTPDLIVIGEAAPRLPNTACVALPGRHAETLIIRLDLAGIAASAGAACSSGKVAESHVLTAMGLEADVVRGAVRISLGPTTNGGDVRRLLGAWGEIGAARAHEKRARSSEMPDSVRHNDDRVSEGI